MEYDPERFDNLNQVINHVGELLEIEVSSQEATLRIVRGVLSLASMTAVLATKVGLDWMIDGPGIPIAQLAGGNSTEVDPT